jgi:RHS repeat-associated protein
VSVSSNDTLVASFAYDTQGRRVKKITGNGTHRYFYDGYLLVYEHITRPDNTVSEIDYVWGKDISSTRDGACGIGGLLCLKRDGAIYVPFYDAYGNVLGYTDALGNVVAEYAYDDFGKIVGKSGTKADDFSFRFSTKYYDVELALYYYTYRYYNPQLMRWLTEDPIAEDGGLNRYGFCGNNPVSRYDKDGRAYFAVRRLGAFKNPIIFSGNLTFLNDWLDQKNMQPLHEQLFFQDGGSLISTGYGKENLDNEPMTGYVITSGGYDDCTMRIAVEKVNPQPYSLIKYNCQDYASQLRAKYYEIKDTEEVRCRCKKERR